MNFTSQSFVVFCAVFFPVYFLTKRPRTLSQFVIVAGSCIFYGWWDWRFLIMFATTTFIDYFVARIISGSNNEKTRLVLLWLSVVSNLAMLGVFKYAVFFNESIWPLFGGSAQPADWMLAIVLPAGISFYTFQSMSYTIDVYRRKITASSTLIEFLAYVSFFPHMVAGPIQKATHFLPQFRSKRIFRFEVATDGLKQIVWGLCKKIVIADNLAPLVDAAFSKPNSLTAPQVAVAGFFFAIQIYCDFSGYTDIAIGLAKIMGFNLSRNFAYPYFATNIQDFWRRWHMSLTNWFREYVYEPLGGHAPQRFIWARNVVIVFSLSGIWHGANWTFLVWGLIHAAAYLCMPTGQAGKDFHLSTATHPLRSPRQLYARHRARTLPPLLGWLLTMFVVTIGWIFFRAHTVADAAHMTARLFYVKDWLHPSNFPLDFATLSMIVLIGCMFTIEWVGRAHDHPLRLIQTGTWRDQAILAPVVIVIAMLSASGASQFIYFQF
jgi:D-alanyl-lipoteichoic acid acyltransferase DltB (MBOAT superfamily)